MSPTRPSPPPPFCPSLSPLPANIASVSRTTYAIEDNGPYDVDEVREKIRVYCDEDGFHAALGLTVIETTEGGTTVRRVEARHPRLVRQALEGDRRLFASGQTERPNFAPIFARQI